MHDSALAGSGLLSGVIDRSESDPPRHNAAIYARTSTTKQKLGYSIDEQVRQCVKRCLALDWTVAFVFRDEAESGKDTDRVMFQEMLTQAKRGLIDVVVFWKLDRFSRSIMHAVQLEKKFRDWGVALHSVTEQIDTTTPSGQFNFRNLANTAEFEREMIRQRTRMGHAARAVDGKWPNGSPPLGYEAMPDGRLRIINSEAELVRWIFDRYIKTKSMAHVTEELNQDHHLEKQCREWTPATVSSVLQNTLYIGHYSVGEVEREEREYRIIPEALFHQANSIRKRFRNSEESSRSSMALDRKERSVNRILEQYQGQLDE